MSGTQFDAVPCSCTNLWCRVPSKRRLSGRGGPPSAQWRMWCASRNRVCVAETPVQSALSMKAPSSFSTSSSRVMWSRTSQGAPPTRERPRETKSVSACVAFADAVGVFEDPNAITIRHEDEEEERSVTLGLDFLGRVLVVRTRGAGKKRFGSCRREHRRPPRLEPTQKVQHEEGVRLLEGQPRPSRSGP